MTMIVGVAAIAASKVKKKLQRKKKLRLQSLLIKKKAIQMMMDTIIPTMKIIQMNQLEQLMIA